MKNSGNQIRIEWQPDKKKKEALKDQIYFYFKKNIASGNWAVGQRIPPQRTLAEQLGVNRSTVCDVLSELISLGLLETKVGSGTFIASNAWPLLVNTPPSWGEHVSRGLFRQNIDSVQMSNQLAPIKKYINLGSNDSPESLFPKSIIGQALKEVADTLPPLNYPDPLGLPDLRDTISIRLKRRQIQAEPKNIMITSGSLQALHLISVSLLGKNMGLISESPSYLNYFQVFRSVISDFIDVPMDPAGLDLTYLDKKRRDKKGQYILHTIPNFQNPTGILMSLERRNAVFEYCKEHQLPIIEDDAYGELWFDEEPPAPIKSRDLSGMVLYTGTISQTFSSGLRIGWIVGPESVIKRLSDVKMQIDCGSSVLPQLLVDRLFHSGYYDEHVEKVRRELRHRRDIMTGLLSEHFQDIAEWDVPKGGFQVWVKLNRPINQKRLFDVALSEGILLNPDDAYSSGGANSLRFSYSNVDSDGMDAAIRLLKRIIAGLQT